MWDGCWMEPTEVPKTQLSHGWDCSLAAGSQLSTGASSCNEVRVLALFSIMLCVCTLRVHCILFSRVLGQHFASVVGIVWVHRHTLMAQVTLRSLTVLLPLMSSGIAMLSCYAAPTVLQLPIGSTRSPLLSCSSPGYRTVGMTMTMSFSSCISCAASPHLQVYYIS
jgi:hypothetical protein